MDLLMRTLLYGFAVLYWLCPYDLDALPLGRLDDALVALAVVLYVRYGLPRYLARRKARAAGKRFDPYRVLAIPLDATREQLMRAYFKKRALFEPGRVAHLGEEFQRNAEEKLEQIERAYRLLLSKISEHDGEHDDGEGERV